MHMAVAQNYDKWLAENTAFCQRLSASITQSACFHNRYLSGDKGADLRCEGCGGLDSQTDAAARPPILSIVAVDTSTCPQNMPAEPKQPDITGEDSASFDGLNFEDMEFDIDDDTLLQLFPELAEELEEIETEERTLNAFVKEAPTRLYAVLQGRCRKCGGYIVSDLHLRCQSEQRDEDISRCYNCGWRTSPEYAFNRENPGVTCSHGLWREY